LFILFLPLQFQKRRLQVLQSIDDLGSSSHSDYLVYNSGLL